MAFTYQLEREDGTPADPPTFDTSIPTWRPGDTIPLGRDRTLRVIEARPGREPDDDPVLVVRPAARRQAEGRIHHSPPSVEELTREN
jgi:hypothetical protein